MPKFVPKPKKIYSVLIDGRLYNETAKLSTAENDVIRGLKKHPDSSFKIVKTIVKTKEENRILGKRNL